MVIRDSIYEKMRKLFPNTYTLVSVGLKKTKHIWGIKNQLYLYSLFGKPMNYYVTFDLIKAFQNTSLKPLFMFYC